MCRTREGTMWDERDVNAKRAANMLKGGDFISTRPTRPTKRSDCKIIQRLAWKLSEEWYDPKDGVSRCGLV